MVLTCEKAAILREGVGGQEECCHFATPRSRRIVINGYSLAGSSRGSGVQATVGELYGKEGGSSATIALMQMRNLHDKKVHMGQG